MPYYLHLLEAFLYWKANLFQKIYAMSIVKFKFSKSKMLEMKVDSYIETKLIAILKLHVC